MIKIYFDWNAMAGFRNPVSEPYHSLFKLIKENEAIVFIPYSPAHVADLLKGWDESHKKDTYTRNDLRFIGEFTRNNMYAQFWKAKDVQHRVLAPETFFDDTKDEKNVSLKEIVDLEKLFAGGDIDDETRTKIDTALAPFKNTTFGDELSALTSNPEFAYISDMLPKSGQTVAQYIQQFAGYMESMINDHTVFKASRDKVHSGFGLKPSEISNWDSKVVEKLDELLLSTPLKKTVSEFVKGNSSESTSENPLYENFLPVYTGLDLFGYRPEELSIKNTFQNMANDADHAFYGAYCNFFVTNDSKTLAKSKAVYEHFGIGTAVCTPSELLVRLLEIIKSAD